MPLIQVITLAFKQSHKVEIKNLKELCLRRRVVSGTCEIMKYDLGSPVKVNKYSMLTLQSDLVGMYVVCI